MIKMNLARTTAVVTNLVSSFLPSVKRRGPSARRRWSVRSGLFDLSSKRCKERSRRLIPSLLVIQIGMAGMIGHTAAIGQDGGPGQLGPAELEQLKLKQQESVQLKRSLQTEQRFGELAVKVRQRGALPVIVRLRVAFEAEGTIRRPERIRAQRQLIERTRKSLLEEATGIESGSVKEFRYLPVVALSVDPTGLESLRNSGEVLDIEEDLLLPPALAALAQSVPLIGANNAWAGGYAGAGQTVAVLDTGVDKSHPFLAGKVISEACYSTTFRSLGASSLCPGGVSATTAPNSGQACNVPGQECKHGTLVAGVIAGNGPSFAGVARESSLISINVYSRFEDTDICGGQTPCVLSFLSDQVRALERVFELRNDLQIAAVNFSLAGRRYTSNCDDEQPSMKIAIDQLASFGIPTVAPTGNRSFSDSIGIPACFSSAISVGATISEDSGAESIYPESNSAPFMHLLAPGGQITSSVPGGEFETWNGTSLAAPHVAGAWALMKQRLPGATVGEVLRALVNTGVPIFDNRNSITKPRLRVDQALRALSENAPVIGSYTLTPGSPIDREPFVVAINGSNFDTAGTRLFFCMVGTTTCQEAPVASISVGTPTQMRVENAILASGSWTMHLQTSAGFSGRSRAFNVMAPPPPPTIASYSWNPTPPLGNQPFSGTISGTGFNQPTGSNGTQVYFCRFDSSTCLLQPAGNVTVNSPTSISLTSIVLESGDWQVYVQTSAGASPRSSRFQVVVPILPPTIASLAWSPSTPTENQPFSGIITGTNFVVGGTQVFFCETGRLTCTQVASGNLTVSGPTSLSLSSVSLRTGSWQAYVQNSAGASAKSAPFTVQPVQLQPTLAGFLWNPPSPTENQPFSGILTGTNFVSGSTQVFFCEANTSNCTAVAAANVTVNSLSSLTVNNVTLGSGSWQCYVTTPAGATPRSAAFTVTRPLVVPTIVSYVLSTPTPVAAQPFSAVVTGTGFITGSTQVFICGNGALLCTTLASGVNVTSPSSLNIANIVLPAGSWQLYVQTAGGNSARSTPFVVQAPLIAPTLSGYTLDPSSPIANAPFAARLSGTGFIPGGTQVFICASGGGACTAVESNGLSIINSGTLNLTGIRLEAGSWQFQVQTTAGSSPRSTVFAVQAPVLAPTLTSYRVNSLNPLANQPLSITITGTGFVSGETQVFTCVSGTSTCFPQAAERITVAGPTSLTVTGIYLLAGSWQLYVQTSGGSSDRSTPFTVKPANVLLPTVTGQSWTPASPSAAIPFSGTLTGTNFVTGGTQVFFCVNASTTCFQHPLENIRVNSSTSLSLSNVFLMVGTWQLYVQTSAGASERSAAFTIGSTQLATPTVASLSFTPTTLTAGQLFGGTITGTNFVTGATQVFFCENEGTSCTEILSESVAVTSPTAITLSNVALASGTWQLYVQTAAGSSNRSNAFSVQRTPLPPSIVGYTWTPSNPAANQPFNGTIAGNNFVIGATQVYFCINSTSACTQHPANNVIVSSNNSISIRNIQLGNGSWQFYVETAAGTSARSTVFNVAATAQFLPTVSGFSWSSSTVVANQPFNGIITGTNFVLGATQVFFCLNSSQNCTRHPSAEVVVSSPTSLNISNISLGSGLWQVYVQTTLGNSSLSTTFTVPEPPSTVPTVTGFSWNPGAPATNQPFSGTITGANFVVGGTQVYFCSSATTSCTQLPVEYVTVTSPTSVIVRNVILASGSWQIYVRTSSGNSARSNSFNVLSLTVQPIQPVLSSFTWSPLVPISGRAFGGTLRGSNFIIGATRVFFCVNTSNNCIEVAGTEVTVTNPTTISLSGTIRLAKGLWQIYIETPNGVSNRSRSFNVL